MNIPKGHENITGGSITSGISEERWTINTGTNSGLSLYTNLWESAANLTYSQANTATIRYYNDNQYICRRPSAIRKPKKKKGDLTNANDSANRLNLLSPVAIFHFVKKRFNLLEQKKLSTRLERVCQLLETARSCLPERFKERKIKPGDDID